MAKLTDTQLLALTTLKREPHAVISVSSERALIRLGLIHPTMSTITLKGHVTLRRSGDVPSVKEWDIVTMALQENETEKCCGAVDLSDLDACGNCTDCTKPSETDDVPEEPRSLVAAEAWIRRPEPCGAVDKGDLDACGQCTDCTKPVKVPGTLVDPMTWIRR